MTQRRKSASISPSPGVLLNGSSMSPSNWRDEMYGDEGGQDPFWVSVEVNEEGDSRDAVEAAVLVKGFIGSLDDGLTVELIRGRIEDCGPDGFRFVKDPEGEHPFWEVCCG